MFMNVALDNYIMQQNMQNDKNESTTPMHNNMDKFKKHKIERETQVKKQSRMWWQSLYNKVLLQVKLIYNTRSILVAYYNARSY